MNDNTNQQIRVPLVCTRGVIVFPQQEVIIDVGRSKSVHAVEDAQNAFDSHVVLVSQKDMGTEDPKQENLYGVGALCLIKHIRRMDGYLRVKFAGMQRARILEIHDEDGYMSADIELLEDEFGDQLEEMALVRRLAKQLENMDVLN
ncbi:MAG: endopeptidase La, partial [Erysipelotrichaceae bacterium]|nr:endopeptidase La [Erysipelotrichaceae bacterium]